MCSCPIYGHNERGPTLWHIWLRHCATSRKVEGSIPRWFHWNFSLCPNYGPGVDSASNRNEYQEYVLGVKVVGG